MATSYAVWAASKSFAAFLASRVIGGISKGNVSLCTAIVADLGSPSARSKGMVSAPWGLGVGVPVARVSLLAQAPSFPQAVIGVAFSLGFTLGPTLGAFLPSETVPCLALLFAVSDLLFIWCFLPETLPPEKRVRWEPDSPRCWGGRAAWSPDPPALLGAPQGAGAERVPVKPTPGPLADPQRRPAQAPSVTLGFRAAADLLSPLALLRFSAVARGPDPPTGVSKERAPGGGAGGPSGRRGGCVRSGPQRLLVAPQGLAACEAWA